MLAGLSHPAIVPSPRPGQALGMEGVVQVGARPGRGEGGGEDVKGGPAIPVH